MKIINILINKIIEYSAKKIKANPPLLYSILNPDTNSDSPSEKSKGARFVSAKRMIIMETQIKIFRKKKIVYFWYSKNVIILNLKINIKNLKKKKIIQIS